MTAVREALARAGVDASHYSGHSFRVGAATTAAQAGSLGCHVSVCVSASSQCAGQKLLPTQPTPLLLALTM